MRYKDTLLLKVGAVIYCCTLILLVIFFDDKYYHQKNSIIENFWFFMFIGLIIAPIIEEISFRGIFLKSKIFKLVSLLLIAFYIYITKNYYLFVIYLFYVLLLYAKYSDKLKINRWLLYFINSLLFALVHYKFSVFYSFERIIPIFIQFSSGLILIWVIINFGLKKSILTHFIINFILITILFLPIQFVDKKEIIIKKEDIYIKYSKTPIVDGKISIFNVQNNNEIIIKKANFYRIMKYFKIDLNQYRPSENPFYYYNIVIISKNKAINNQRIEELFLENKLIEKYDELDY
jgi:membrane protease YdiL (CAAX protease family)